MTDLHGLSCASPGQSKGGGHLPDCSSPAGGVCGRRRLGFGPGWAAPEDKCRSGRHPGCCLGSKACPGIFCCHDGGWRARISHALTSDVANVLASGIPSPQPKSLRWSVCCFQHGCRRSMSRSAFGLISAVSFIRALRHAAARRRGCIAQQSCSSAQIADGGRTEAAAGVQGWPALLLLARPSPGGRCAQPHCLHVLN